VWWSRVQCVEEAKCHGTGELGEELMVDCERGISATGVACYGRRAGQRG
jgi:hypothetical protein